MRIRIRSGFCTISIFAALLLAVTACAEDGATLVNDQPQLAGISGFRVMWNTPVVLSEDGPTADVDKGQFGKAPSAFWFSSAKQRKNADGSLKNGAPVFDAVHRSLLVRFPGSAAAIGVRLKNGDKIQKIELILPFKNYELWPEGYAEPAGMSFLGAQWANWKPHWHAVAWMLRKPWLADDKLGPTFNANINGVSYWKKFGAQDETEDRFPNRFGPEEVSSTQAEGHIDVTASLTDAAFGKTIAERLRSFETNGFLVRKLEVYDAALWAGSYEWQTATGPHGILIAKPKLIVTFASGGEKAQIGDADLNVDTAALITAKKIDGAGSHPTAALATGDELKTLLARFAFARPAWMPEWQWQRVHELASFSSSEEFPTTEEGYQKWIDQQLAVAPRAWRGFDSPELVENYFKYLDALPEPVREHWRLYWWAWLAPDRDFPKFDYNGKSYPFAQGYIGGKEAQAYYKETNDWRGNFSLYRTYCYAMGTMNFNNWCCIGTLGGGCILNSPRLIEDGRHGVETWSLRTWSWFDGSTQESIDHYYFAESLKAQKCIADWSPTQFERMMGRSILAKSIEELASSYHPNLRRFISSSGRTGICMLLGTQDGLQHILHTLSVKGTITDTAVALDKEKKGSITAANVEKMPVLGHNLLPSIVAQQTTTGPWAPEWFSNIIDEKPLPYEATNSYKQWGNFAATPLWKRSYLGQNYGLATMDVSDGETVPVMAQWRRDEKQVESMTQIGTLLARAGVNRTELLDSTMHGTDKRNPNGVVGSQGYRQFALQHRNKAIVLTSPNDKLQGDANHPPPDEIASLQTTLGFFNFETNPTWELYVDGQRVTQFPFKAKLSQRITIKDGVSFIGIAPLPATDLGRSDEVVIADEGKMTVNQSGGTSREALRINLYNFLAAAPTDKKKIEWAKIDRACNGFVLEVGDQKEYADFAAFQKHFNETKLDAVWDEAKGVLNVSYKRVETICWSAVSIRSITEARRPTRSRIAASTGSGRTTLPASIAIRR